MFTDRRIEEQGDNMADVSERLGTTQEHLKGIDGHFICGFAHRNIISELVYKHIQITSI